MEHSLHHLPLLVAGGSGAALLKLSHMLLPFLLSGQCGQACHGCVPVEIQWRFYYHKEAIAKQIDFHFEYSHRENALFYLVPEVLFVVGLAIAAYQFGVVAQLHSLAVAFHCCRVGFCFVSLCSHIIGFLRLPGAYHFVYFGGYLGREIVFKGYAQAHKSLAIYTLARTYLVYVCTAATYFVSQSGHIVALTCYHFVYPFTYMQVVLWSL